MQRKAAGNMAQNLKDTAQLVEWRGDFGKSYTDRNSLSPEQVDALWVKNYGISRTGLNRKFLMDVPANSRILEVGCNIANQLLLLQRMGYSDLHGIEVQKYAVDIARSRTKNINLLQGSAFDLPYEDGFFDMVFTTGVLIHIAPADLPRALDEIHRCARAYILGAEYYSSTATEVSYRDRAEMLWKMDYAHEYLNRFPDLKLVEEIKLRYTENENIDSMFLLRKTS